MSTLADWVRCAWRKEGKLCSADNEVTKSEEITSAAAIRDLSYVSPLRCCTPSLTERHMIHFQSEYQHISAFIFY